MKRFIGNLDGVVSIEDSLGSAVHEMSTLRNSLTICDEPFTTIQRTLRSAEMNEATKRTTIQTLLLHSEEIANAPIGTKHHLVEVMIRSGYVRDSLKVDLWNMIKELSILQEGIDVHLGDLVVNCATNSPFRIFHDLYFRWKSKSNEYKSALKRNDLCGRRSAEHRELIESEKQLLLQLESGLDPQSVTNNQSEVTTAAASHSSATVNTASAATSSSSIDGPDWTPAASIAIEEFTAPLPVDAEAAAASPDLDISLVRSRAYWDEYFAAEVSSAPQSSLELQTAPARASTTGRVEWIASWEEMERAGVFDTKMAGKQKEEEFELKKEDKILILGCGSSNLGETLYDRGFRHIDSMDISPVVIAAQREAHRETRPGMKWWVGSCTDMSETVRDGAYDVVIDKGTADTLQFRCPSNRSQQLLGQMLKEVHRILTPTGTYICITTRRRVTPLYQPYYTWSVRRINIATNEKERRVRREFLVKMDAAEGEEGGESGKVASQSTPSPSDSAAVASTSAVSPSPSPSASKPPHTASFGAYAMICMKRPPPSSASTTVANSTTGSTGQSTIDYTHNIPKVVREAQELLKRIAEQQILVKQLLATTTWLTRAQLQTQVNEVLQNQYPSLPAGDHTPILVQFNCLVLNKRKLGNKLIIMAVKVLDTLDEPDSAPDDGTAAATSTNVLASKDSSSTVAPSSSTSDSKSSMIDLDGLEVLSPIEDFSIPPSLESASETTFSSNEPPSSSSGTIIDGPSIPASHLAAFDRMHSLVRKHDTIHCTGFIGRNRTAGQPVIYLTQLQFIRIGQARAFALQQRAEYHAFGTVQGKSD